MQCPKCGNQLTKEKERKPHEQFIKEFNEVGNHGRSVISQAVPLDYSVTRAWVRGQIGRASIRTGGFSGVTCSIPINGHKGTIGGRFSAEGGYQGRPIRARIMRIGMTTLPRVMRNQGGNPPFINPTSARLNGVAFTRRTNARNPIVRVVGLGAPQMPLNQSAEYVQENLLDYAIRRLEHNFDYMITKGNG